MLFNSKEFLFLFLPITLLGAYLLGAYKGKSAVLIWMTACSLFFYGWFRLEHTLILALSIGVNYFLGNAILECNIAQRAVRRDVLLAIGLIFNLALLGYFKYYAFLWDTVTALSGGTKRDFAILLPLGISFFTFQKVAYLMDCRAGTITRPTLLEYTLFVTYFPQLIAGPIVHPNHLIPQLRVDTAFRFNGAHLLDGLIIFALGLFKKVVLADHFAPWADSVFTAAARGSAVTAVEAWAGAISYSLQIYFDFSGYSDMAIGLARMSGIALPVNFRSPYKAKSIVDFWRRWHITLSTFLRDYLYIPLGGSRKGQYRRWLNLLMTMVIGGLWHGAAWTFVLWGALHGGYLVVNHAWSRVSDAYFPALKRARLWQAFAWVLTMFCVMIAWVFFRAESFATAMTVIDGMFFKNGVMLPTELAVIAQKFSKSVVSVSTLPSLGSGNVLALMEVALFIALGVAMAVAAPRIEQCSRNARICLFGLSITLTLQRVLVSTKPSAFLYFQF